MTTIVKGIEGLRDKTGRHLGYSDWVGDDFCCGAAAGGWPPPNSSDAAGTGACLKRSA